ncbi:heme lyase CcmF/NrfE family subunit [Desulfovibrio inopinatus]|uniref:heme lyase CcmF/NrfE family subunit n=1 Tax=Desulfovibrio inopinatus TaxID=102109 RepID=UPI0003FF53A2|nr:cytochrome c-type biogenesis CcmF C-terminal domain-containing protein [Desulfovibrio inopinatus]
MRLVAYWSLLAALVMALFLAGTAAYQTYRKQKDGVLLLERGQTLICLLFSLSSGVLFYALWSQDFSYKYVADYTDSLLPMFYTITAFWAGQAGSILFWGWMTSLCGLIFSLTPAYETMSDSTKRLFWLFYLSVLAFFLLVLTGPNNPFIGLSPAPADGKGLNPLLQNPGMIFHPPLLFLGYAGFCVPACLGLAAWMTDETGWLDRSRNFTIISWVFLTAGIILGGWWSYMELGWGGYWAWDPVENASLIPWLVGTAFIHTAIVGRRFKIFGKTNVFLAMLTLVLCFFGTYLVRSGVIDSLHAFGDGGVGLPLLLFVLYTVFVTAIVLFVVVPHVDFHNRPLSGMLTLSGTVTVLVWLMIALGLVVFLGTMWPVLSKPFTQSPVGLDAGFYNRVCPPLFAVVMLLVAICPWLPVTEKPVSMKSMGLLVAGLVLAAVGSAVLGITLPVSVICIASALVCLAGILILFITKPAARRHSGALGAYLVHAGLAFVVIGIAVSGPYQLNREAILKPDQSFEEGGYRFTYKAVTQSKTPAMAIAEAEILVEKAGKRVGVLHPQRRVYHNFNQPFAEVSVIPSLGDEVYATLLAFTESGSASIKVSINPLVNWIWIGGTLMCLAGLVALRRYRVRRS